MVDDDLFAAFSEPGDSEQDDDPFASLDSAEEDDPFASLGFDEARDDLFAPVPPEEPAPAVADEEPEWETVAAEEPPPVTDERPDWLRELGGFEEEETQKAPSPVTPRPSAQQSRSGVMSGLVGKGSKGMAFGMTAQQRMILAIFLFLDVAVLACVILIAIGAVNVGLP
jgi:hypothetical protein